jgi:hypothetical protein
VFCEDSSGETQAKEPIQNTIVRTGGHGGPLDLAGKNASDLQDPEVLQVWIVDMSFIGKSTPDIGHKFQKIEEAMEMNLSQLVDIVYKV